MTAPHTDDRLPSAHCVDGTEARPVPAMHQLELASDVPLPAMGLYSAGSPLNRLRRRRARAPWLLAAAIIVIGVLLGAIWLLLG